MINNSVNRKMRISNIFGYNNLSLMTQKKIIIYGCFKSAREFAIRLLNHGIYFTMFLLPDMEGKYELPCIFNKRVIDLAQCQKLDDYIIAVSYYDREEAKDTLQKYGLAEKIVEEQLSDSIINSSNLILYGTGGRAERFYEESKDWFEFRYICDSDVNKLGKYWHGKEIINPQSLPAVCKDSAIIIASTYVDEIFDVLSQYSIEERKIFAIEYEYKLLISSDVNKSKSFEIKQEVLAAVLRDIRGKYCVLYGESQLIEDIIFKFKLLDIIFDDVVIRNSEKEDGTIFNLAYKPEDALFIIAEKYSREKYKNLFEMEIDEKSVIWIEQHNSIARVNKNEEFNTVLDPNIGHAYIGTEDEYPGFVTYKYNNLKKEQPIRIVALGGSTTMGYGLKTFSWSKYLSEFLKKDNISHIIYCGGVDAYTASNELTKLARDVLWMKPDLVISYSGTNNMSIPLNSIKNPFIGYYQEDLFEKISGSIKVKVFGAMHGVNYGVNPKVSQFEYFYKQLEMMQAICEKSSVYYKAFLQPVLAVKKRYFDLDGEIAALDDWYFDKEKNEYVSLLGHETEMYNNYLNYAKEFAKCAAKKSDSWFCDLSALFENIEGVYVDRCHVYDRGNYLVAERIFKELKNTLLSLKV